MGEHDMPGKKFYSGPLDAKNHDESFWSTAAVPEDHNTWQSLVVGDPLAFSPEREPEEEEVNKMAEDGIEHERVQKPELILLPKMEIKSEPEEEMNEGEDPEDTWQTLTEEDPVPQSLGRQPREEPNQMLGNNLEDETLQMSELILLPKIEIKCEPEDETNEEENPEECVGEMSNMQSISNAMSISCNENNPNCTPNNGTVSSPKNTLRYGKKQTTEGVASTKILKKHDRSVKKNKKIFGMTKTKNKESASAGSGNEGMDESEREDREGSHCRERQSSLPKKFSERNGNTKNRDSPCCQICGKYFGDNILLEYHNCVSSSEMSFKCHFCEESFAEESALLVHMNVHLFKCPVCKELFTRKRNLEVHMRIHTGDKTFECTICKKPFSQSSALNLHKLLHSGEKPFSCDVCKRAFAQKGYLITHMRTHTGEKPFKCGFCGKAFAQNGTLTNHMRSHTGRKPYECAQCDKAFGHRNLLNEHARTHTAQGMLTCEICGKRFSRSDTLRRHTRQVHAAAPATS